MKKFNNTIVLPFFVVLALFFYSSPVFAKDNVADNEEHLIVNVVPKAALVKLFDAILRESRFSGLNCPGDKKTDAVQKKQAHEEICQDYYYYDKEYESEFLRIQIRLEYAYLEHYNIPRYPFAVYALKHLDTFKFEELILVSRLIHKARQFILKTEMAKQKTQ